MAVQSNQEEVGILWERVLARLRTRVESPQTLETWFMPIVPREMGPERVELEVPNTFSLDWIHAHYLPVLQESLKDSLGYASEIRLLPRQTAPAPAPPPREPRVAVTPPPPGEPRTWTEHRHTSRLTFETFVVGGSNRFTHAASLAVAKHPGHVYNPLFIFGGSGLGKTHLLHAIAHMARQLQPDLRVHYVPAERFMNEMIYAIQHGQQLSFRNRYRNVDLLLIDDIQFLAGKESTQEEFFYTFNTLRDAHKQIVVTADKAPKDLPMLEERLTSRFNHGLVADIKQPDVETRIAILRNRWEVHGAGVTVGDDVLLLIADRIRNNIRDLEGCLVRLLAVASLSHQEVTCELAEEVLAHYVNPEAEQLTPERILAAVSERFGIRSDALVGSRRTRSVALPRQVAMYLMRQLTEMSLVEIGRIFGGRDHTTVLYACDKVGTLINDGDAPLQERINGLISTLSSG